MPVPDFQSVMLPLLRLVSDGKEHTVSEAVERLATEFNLSVQDREELLPSGRQARFANRVAWACTYFKKAQVLESCGRATFRITQRGLEVLRSQPETINIRFLERYPEFMEFRYAPSTRREEGEAGDVEVAGATPDEAVEATYQRLRRGLVQELLERVKTCSPTFFERLVLEVLVKMGYGGSLQDAIRAVGRSGDEGIDGIIKEDKLGLDTIYVQAKRWKGTVGRPVVQAFAGSLEGQRARRGILITTSQFSPDAREYVSRIEKKIVLIDGEELAQYMIDYDVGVGRRAVYEIKAVQEDYFSEG